ncbi:WD and tetratricopeptide repeats protein 1 [Eumeta japonica]|uniref:WD and tetratricopeptide repeats protein 1 n=1 Tax=Eumeta variegata TaxID=151549 RepID=A0A4C1TPB7_EUMVA|nr:WD and tetratricopeptide repeats protein 1 [Eumeta japonica]
MSKLTFVWPGLLELGRLQDADECLKELMRRFPGYATNHGVIMLNDDIKENMQTILQQQQEQRRPAVDMLDRGEMSDDEFYWRCKAKDYTQRFVGHCNTTTDIKEANYFGFDGHYIVAGSDDAIKIYQHSEYNPTTISYDFSIVQLEDYEESSLPFPIQYAQLPAEDNIEDGTDLMVAGWVLHRTCLNREQF